MLSRKMVPCIVLLSLVLTASAFSMIDRPSPQPPPLPALSRIQLNEPWVLSSAGDTVWIQVHTDSTYCPGDPSSGHGGETTGGPGALETWCFEGGAGDTCGTNPPWDTNCFSHVDARTDPSPSDINFWHIDTYRTDQRAYCGNYALWCGSDSLWADGNPVECGTWLNTPGYADLWNCVVQLTLPDTFDVAAGCTLLFDPRYDTECKYDYFYVDFWNGTEWTTLATFNASSNNPGAECGSITGGNPDYWGNTDSGQPNFADWQARYDPDLPAFYRVLAPDTLLITSGPRFRWRFVSDGAWSDADGRGDTDGAAFIDNVWVWGDGERYQEDFETGVLDTSYWSVPDNDGVADAWHIVHDADPPYEGGDGSDQLTCTLDSSYAYRARPEAGYPGGASWRNGWYYRLMSPTVPIQNSGCVVQSDFYCHRLLYTCDIGYIKVRFHRTGERWCPWVDLAENHAISWCTQYYWSFDWNVNVTYYGPESDSVQFAWELIDTSYPTSTCRGKHKQTDLQVDNVSIGFYDATSTRFDVRSTDLLHDTFYDNLCGYNSFFDTYDQDTVDYYAGPPYDTPLPRCYQFWVDVYDKDGISGVYLYGSVDKGGSWVTLAMAADHTHEYGGDYYGTLCPDDFGLATWEVGAEVWYYAKATDSLSNVAYFPAAADPASQHHTGTSTDYLTFSILPLFPDTYTGPKILLVDGYGGFGEAYGRPAYDWAECLSSTANRLDLEAIYGRVLSDAGYCYDIYDIQSPASNVHIHPALFDDYDCVIWFTGPYLESYPMDLPARAAIIDYLNAGGKVVTCSDRLAYYMSQEVCGPPDSLCGEVFLGWFLGAEYLDEMPGPFTYPYVYAVAEDSVNVFGNPVSLDLDSLLIYRECPYLKEMSFVRTDPSPIPGTTAQPVMYVANTYGGYTDADEVIYSEHEEVGQAVFINFDLSASVNHERGYCSGGTAEPAPGFSPGIYDGRVELMRVILEDLFGLPSIGGGGEADVEEPELYHRWSLAQNVPNPCITLTEIRYEVGRPCRVTLKVYNAQGQVVRVLEDGRKGAGVHTASWDGRNGFGVRVSSGVYFYKFESDGYNATRKLIVAR